jgi:hypothetical protein
VEPEIEALSVDPLTFGNVRETFARFVRNGETVVCVRAASDEEAEFAAILYVSMTRSRSMSYPFRPSWNSGNPIPDRT